MPILQNKEECNGYTRFLSVTELDQKNRKEARTTYARYRLSGTIIGGTFDDDEWWLTNEVNRIRLSFSIDSYRFTQSAQEWIGCTCDCYQECMKAYITFLLGSFTLSTIRLITGELKRLAVKTAEDACSRWKESVHIIGFLSLIPDSNSSRDAVIEWLEEQGPGSQNAKNPRKLTDFRYYLRFHKLIGDYWEGTAAPDKVRYFPVYLWWNLTAILPLRATEFLLLPQDCLRQHGSQQFLTIRRTRMKKARQQISYTVNEDYEQMEYEVPEWMAIQIREYQRATATTERNGLKTLFVAGKESSYGFLTYTQANRLLRSFCKEVVGDPKFPIRLGDTRHLAMINLILSGGSPVICRELAGHESIDISSNYYANLSSVVESVVYERCHGRDGDTAMEGSLCFRIRNSEKGTKLPDGWCDIPEVADGDIEECMKVYHVSGHIGNCMDCPHFYSDVPGIRLRLENQKKTAVDEDVAFLVHMIEQVRRGNGYTEDIQAALLRLQNSTFDYEHVLARKYGQEDN